MVKEGPCIAANVIAIYIFRKFSVRVDKGQPKVRLIITHEGRLVRIHLARPAIHPVQFLKEPVSKSKSIRFRKSLFHPINR